MATERFVIRNKDNVNGTVKELLSKTKTHRQGNGNFVGKITDPEIISYISNSIGFLIKNGREKVRDFVGIFSESDVVNVVTRNEASNEPLMWFILKAYVLYIIKIKGNVPVPKAVVVPAPKAVIVPAPKAVVAPAPKAVVAPSPKAVVAPAPKTVVAPAPVPASKAVVAPRFKPQNVFIDPVALKDFMSGINKVGHFFSLNVNISTNKTDLTQESYEKMMKDADVSLLISFDPQTKMIQLMSNKTDIIQNAVQVLVNNKIIKIEIKTEVYQKSEDLLDPDNKLKSMIYAYLDDLDTKEDEKEKKDQTENTEQTVINGSDMSSDDDLSDNDNSKIAPPKAQKRLKVSQRKAAKDKDKKKNRSDDNSDFNASSVFSNRKKSNDGIDYGDIIDKLQGPNPEYLIGLISQFANGKYINVDTKNGSKIGVLSGSMRNSQRINRLAKGDFVLCSIRGNMSSNKFGSQDGMKVDVFHKINGHLANQLCADHLIPKELGKQQEKMIIGDAYDDEFDGLDIIFDANAKSLIQVSNDDYDNATMQFDFDMSASFTKRSKPSEKTRKLSETSRRESRDKKNEM